MELLIIILLVGASLAGLTFIVERGLALRWKKVVPPEIENAIANYRNVSDLPMLRRVCEQNPAPLSRLLLLADRNRDWPREENVDALQTRARHEVARLERGLVVLEIVVGIAPLLGLVGTIYGLIVLFGGMGQSDLGDNTYMARGIAIALNATLMGLLTAIPSLIAWSYYNKKVETLAVEMETICDEFLRRQYRNEQSETASAAKD
jgi:biopolymer transport protein ExbB